MFDTDTRAADIIACEADAEAMRPVEDWDEYVPNIGDDTHAREARWDADDEDTPCQQP